MRHLTNRTTLRYVTDPATGRNYPIPAGGSDDDQQDDQQDDVDEDEDDDQQDDDGPGDDEDADDGDEDTDDGDEDQLGDAGKKALDRMKAKWKRERDRRRALEQQLDGDDGDDADDTPDPIAVANQRILKAEIKAAAAGQLADPTDAYKFLDLTEFEVDDDGNVDVDEINDAIETLIADKPYLATQGDRRFKGTADGGARKGGSKPKQLSRSDLQRMSPEQIAKAKSEGRLDKLLGR